MKRSSSAFISARASALAGKQSTTANNVRQTAPPTKRASNVFIFSSLSDRPFCRTCTLPHAIVRPFEISRNGVSMHQRRSAWVSKSAATKNLDCLIAGVNFDPDRLRANITQIELADGSVSRNRSFQRMQPDEAGPLLEDLWSVRTLS